MTRHTAVAESTVESRQDRRRARTRAELLAAAKRLLASKGFHGTKIADIAAAADVGTGTFYLYFPTKEALFEDLVKETALRMKEEIDRAKDAVEDPRDQARVATETFFRFADRNRDVFKILFGHGARFNELLRDVHQLFIVDAEENTARGIALGAFKPLRPAIVAQGIVGLLSQVVSWWLEHDDIAIEEIIGTAYEMLQHGIAIKENTHE
jgi:AcrR family transcriptional regulator